MLGTVLIVDDDPNIRELVRVFLQEEGLVCLEAATGVEALTVLESGQVALVVLDIMMPEMDGWMFCEQARALYPELPILMLTAKGETAQKVKGFRLGADDYLVKPFEPIELVMRIKALLRRYQAVAAFTVQVGSLVIDQQSHVIHDREKDYVIPLKEFELLFTLAASAGRTFSREDLIEKIWGYDFAGDERTVDVHIKRLRERFNSNDCGFSIRTVRGLGYRLEEIS